MAVEEREAERRRDPYCNLYDLHCKQEFAEIKGRLTDIQSLLVGEEGNGLVVQQKLNTAHRLWLEKVWSFVVNSLVVSGISFIGALLWIVFSHKKS